MKKTIFIAGFVLAFGGFSVESQAADCEVKGKSYKLCKQARRTNDHTIQFMIDHDGGLWRQMDGGIVCQVTTEVKDIKMSVHPRDISIAYFEKNDGHLYYLRDTGDVNGNNCPKQDKKVLTRNVERWNTVPAGDSILVNVSLDSDGVFRAWGNSDGPKVVVENVKTYRLNTCYGRKGKHFSKSIAFLEVPEGVMKLEGLLNGSPSSSKIDDTSRTISEFKGKNKQLCKDAN